MTGQPVAQFSPSALRPLAAVVLSTLGVGLTFGFQPPLIAFILERDGASSFEIGLVTAASTFAVILLGPVYPRLIAWLGVRTAVLIGTAATIIALLAMPVLTSVPAWLVLRFATGCGLGLEWIASEVWLNRLATDRTRGRIMGVYSSVFAAGVVAGPLLLQITGTAGWRPFLAGAIGLAITAAPLFGVRQVPDAGQDLRNARPIAVLVRAAPVVMLAALVAGLVESADLSLLPLFGLHAGLAERTALMLVTVFLAGNIVLQLPIGTLGDRYGRRAVLMGCAIVSAVGPMLLPGVLPVPALLWPLLFFWGGTMYGFYTQGIALLGETFAADELGAANTAFVMAYCAGGVIGPSLGGLAMDVWMPQGFIVFVSVASALLIAGLLLEGRRSSRWRTGRLE
jgi:MFS family permease